MLEHALKARIPVIGVDTDDLPNFTASLQLIAGKVVAPWPTTGKVALNPNHLYWSDDLEVVTVESYKKLVHAETQLVIINPEKPSKLVFHAGMLPTPPELIRDYLLNFMDEEKLPAVMQAVKGLSLKATSEVVMLTMARTQALLPAEIRRTRSMVGGAVHGLYPVDAEFSFYECPPELALWLEINDAYFLNPKTPKELVPRGLLLAGPPGTGKSLASKAIAKHYDIPLYRLDIATSLNRYYGESEARIAQSLSMVEREAPCVLLIDEVEKVFSQQEDTGMMTRILSQLLWWLADHQQKVLTIMTTNNLQHIPPELYRPGRIDMVLQLPPLTLQQAKQFAVKVFSNLLGAQPTLKQNKTMVEMIEARGLAALSHSDVTTLVYEAVKQHKWLVLS